jgi:hypothetical protein
VRGRGREDGGWTSAKKAQSWGMSAGVNSAAVRSRKRSRNTRTHMNARTRTHAHAHTIATARTRVRTCAHIPRRHNSGQAVISVGVGGAWDGVCHGAVGSSDSNLPAL